MRMKVGSDLRIFCGVIGGIDVVWWWIGCDCLVRRWWRNVETVICSEIIERS